MNIRCRASSIIMGLMLTLIVGSTFAQATSAANPRYVIRGGEVYDKKTDLTWQRCSVGQYWVEGTGCVGIVKEFTFDDAQRNDRAGWRVSSKDELVTLHMPKTSIEIDEVAFPDMDPRYTWYWTSTPNGATFGWAVHFNSGSVDYYGRSYTYAVRLVRGGQ